MKDVRVPPPHRSASRNTLITCNSAHATQLTIHTPLHALGSLPPTEVSSPSHTKTQQGEEQPSVANRVGDRLGTEHNDEKEGEGGHEEARLVQERGARGRGVSEACCMGGRI